MVEIDNEGIFLLLLKKEKTIIPVTSSAFHVSQSSRKVLDLYNEALVVAPDGSAQIIRQIDILSFWGETLGRKIVSALTGAHKISVQFDSVLLELKEFKILV